MKQIALIIILLSIAITAQSIYKETYEKEYFRGKYPQKIPLLFRAYPERMEKDLFRIYIPVEIKYNFLQFIYNNGNYSAKAEIEALFTHYPSGKVYTKIWRTGLETESFALTHSKSRFHFTEDTLYLPQGRYDIIIKYRDLNGEQRLSLKQRLTLKNEENFYASPPLFVHPGQPQSRLLTAVKGSPSPLLQYWDFNHDLGIYFQIWRSDSTMKVPVYVEIINGRDGSLVFSSDTVLDQHANRESFQIDIPLELLPEGRYRLKAAYRFAGDSTRHLIPFDIIWFDKPISLWDEELTIEPLQYILSEAAYKQLKEGDDQARLEKLNKFWGERDPTPETPYNELKAEFYTRVDSSLARFSTRGRLGWKTDLGKIYISNGPPDRVEDQSLAPIPNPYLKWIYYQDGKELVYTFKALDGRKEYQLADTRESKL